MLNKQARSREELERAYGQVWNTKQLTEDFVVLGFLAPFVEVVRKKDKKAGMIKFQHEPRFYFHFMTPEDLDDLPIEDVFL